ncbi:MAG: hypothetical protein P1P84_02860 [Deferrisomatales bacterium]|nr:hypothetical protein [Deferrisomatales bacterium]
MQTWIVTEVVTYEVEADDEEGAIEALCALGQDELNAAYTGTQERTAEPA